MSPVVLRLVDRLHGLLGWLAVAALAHPALLLRRPRRRAPLSAALSTSLATAAAAAGAWLYPRYREQLKQPLFLASPATGWLFERKEHVAVGAVALAWAGLLLHLAAPDAPAEARDALERAAHRSYLAAALLALATAVLGVAVAVRAPF